MLRPLHAQLIRTAALEPFFELGRPWKAMDLPAESFAFLPCWFSCGWAAAAAAGVGVNSFALRAEPTWQASLAFALMSCSYAFSGVNGLWDIKPPAAVSARGSDCWGWCGRLPREPGRGPLTGCNSRAPRTAPAGCGARRVPAGQDGRLEDVS